MRNNSKKNMAVFVATAVLITICIMVALAVNAKLHEVTCAFQGATETESVPLMMPIDGIDSDGVEKGKSQVNVAEAVEGKHIQFPIESFAKNGVFMVCTDEVQMNSGNHYAAYYEENGECIRLEEHTFSQNYHILGNDIHLEFQWVEHEGNVSFTYTETDIPLYKPDCAGSISSSLMMLCIDPPGDLEYTRYPVLINFETGELTDICADIGIEGLPEILQASISPDLTKMVLVDTDKNLYFIDLRKKGLCSVDELIGKKISSCVLTNEKIVCLTEENGIFSAYAFEFTTGKTQKVYSGRPEFIKGIDHYFVSSALYLGTRFALETDANRNVFWVDLTDGTKSRVDGFLWPEVGSGKVECIPSADGNKLLICTRALSHYASVGVLDFSSQQYVPFSCEERNDVDERAAYWFDNDSVIIESCSDGSSKDYYIYRLSSK